ncbi:uncharacterized [Tachysurus ichikawai]
MAYVYVMWQGSCWVIERKQAPPPLGPGEIVSPIYFIWSRTELIDSRRHAPLASCSASSYSPETAKARATWLLLTHGQVHGKATWIVQCASGSVAMRD